MHYNTSYLLLFLDSWLIVAVVEVGDDMLQRRQGKAELNKNVYIKFLIYLESLL